jgi:hypothetical protein
MSGAVNSANDARRKSDLLNIVKGILAYQSTGNTLPASCNTLSAGCLSVISVYLPIVPDDPDSTKSYVYAATGTDFTLVGTLSNNHTYSFDSISGVWTDTASLSCSANWVDSGHGFCVMQYEARNAGGVATSQTGGTIWASLNQAAAVTACSNLGSGAHLITNAEWTLLARDIEGVGANWTGGTVGSGILKRGNVGDANAGDYNSAGDPDTGNSNALARLQLANGNYIWHLSGNVYEWTSDTCSTAPANWYYNGAWLEWTDANLADYEKGAAGPAGAYTSANGAGQYYGCRLNGNAFMRGGAWGDGSNAGLYNFNLNDAPTNTNPAVGFRCVR